jgi:NADPH:quinone reductase
MKIVGARHFGGPDVLEVLELPSPEPGPGEVRIRVHAAAVNPTDTLLRAGLLLARMSNPEPPHIPGMDAAGVIDQLGPGSEGRLSIGQPVIALVVPTGARKGAYAEQIVVPAASVVPIPEGASFAEASTLLMNGLTARIALDALDLGAGQTVAVTGAAGALGGYTVQLAKADGLLVVADASEADARLVHSLGADHVVLRGNDVADRIREVVLSGVDGLVDAALLGRVVHRAVADGGGVSAARDWTESAERGVTVHNFKVSESARQTDRLDRLRRQVESGAITLRVARVFPAAQAAEAHRQLEAGGVRGRLVLDFMDFRGQIS